MSQAYSKDGAGKITRRQTLTAALSMPSQRARQTQQSLVSFLFRKDWGISSYSRKTVAVRGLGHQEARQQSIFDAKP